MVCFGNQSSDITQVYNSIQSQNGAAILSSADFRLQTMHLQQVTHKTRPTSS